MLNTDFQAMKKTGSIGKILERISVKSLNLGTSFPMFKKCVVMRPRTGDIAEGDRLDFAVDIEYHGRPSVTVRADLAWGKTATINLTISELSGRMKFSFLHFPEPHWSMSFFEEPTINFEVESVFEGATVPQLSSLIVNQIKRVIRKRHTLPASRMRYKPFFSMPEDVPELNVNIGGLPLQEGVVKLKVCGARQLRYTRTGSHLFCVVSLNDLEESDDDRAAQRKKASQKQTQSLQVEVKLDDVSSGGAIADLGLVFAAQTSKKTDAPCRVAALLEGSPLQHTTLEIGDVIDQINGVPITSRKQALRLISKAGALIQFSATREVFIDSAVNDGIESEAAKTKRTQLVAVSESPQWNTTVEIPVTGAHRKLFVRIFDRKLHSNGKKIGKDFLIACTEVKLEALALFCVTHKASMREKFPLRATRDASAMIIGSLELQADFTPAGVATSPYMTPSDAGAGTGSDDGSAAHQSSGNTAKPASSSAYNSLQGTPAGSPTLRRRNVGGSANRGTNGSSSSSSSVGRGGGGGGGEGGSRNRSSSRSGNGSNTPDGGGGDGGGNSGNGGGFLDKLEGIFGGGNSNSNGNGSNGGGVGSELFTDLPNAERRMELDELMVTVQTQIDLESETRTELERQLDAADSNDVRLRLEANIKCSDERMSLLANRMLRVMSAVQTID